MPLRIYLPQDRLRAFANHTPLSDRTSGAALFTDISGFTALTEALRNGLGPRRVAEELTRRMEAVYSTLIGEIERHGGSVISFAGDSLLCWFDEAGVEEQECGDESSAGRLRDQARAVAENIAAHAGEMRDVFLGQPTMVQLLSKN